MSDGAISQDEIDALLSGVDMGGMGTAAPTASAAHVDTNALNGFFASLKDTFAQNLTTITGGTASVSAPQLTSYFSADWFRSYRVVKETWIKWIRQLSCVGNCCSQGNVAAS